MPKETNRAIPIPSFTVNRRQYVYRGKMHGHYLYRLTHSPLNRILTDEFGHIVHADIVADMSIFITRRYVIE